MSLDPDKLPGVTVRPRVWYNPEMRSANFMIPGIIGKVAPYIFIAFFDVLEVLAIGVFWFGVPIRGNL